MGAEGFGCGAPGNGLQNRGLHLEKAALLEKAPGLAHNRDALFKYGAGTLVGQKIEITLPVTGLNVLKSVPFFGERPQSFGQHLEGAHLQCWFSTFREETCSLDANEIADVEQAKKIHLIGADFFRVNINLNAAGGVAQVEKMASAHVAMSGDAASGPEGCSLLKFFAHLRDRAARLEASAEWLHAFRAERVEFLAPQRDQLILFVHLWGANVKRRRKMNSLKECWLRHVKPLNHAGLPNESRSH